jgi:hypothetical protein
MNGLSPALDWLDADFEHGLRRYQRKLTEGTGHHWRGPAVIRPMIQLRSPLERCEPMRVTYADYYDPERWWL